MATSLLTARCAASAWARCAPVAAQAASSSPGSFSGPITHGAMASRDAPAACSRATAASRLARSPSEAGTAGTASRDESSTAATPAAFAASSPPSASTMMPLAGLVIVRPLVREARASPASASRACRASAISGCGPSGEVSKVGMAAAVTALASAVSERGCGPASSGTMTDGWVGGCPSGPGAASISVRLRTEPSGSPPGWSRPGTSRGPRWLSRRRCRRWPGRRRRPPRARAAGRPAAGSADAGCGAARSAGPAAADGEAGRSPARLPARWAGCRDGWLAGRRTARVAHQARAAGGGRSAGRALAGAAGAAAAARPAGYLPGGAAAAVPGHRWHHPRPLIVVVPRGARPGFADPTYPAACPDAAISALAGPEHAVIDGDQCRLLLRGEPLVSLDGGLGGDGGLRIGVISGLGRVQQPRLDKQRLGGNVERVRDEPDDADRWLVQAALDLAQVGVGEPRLLG